MRGASSACERVSEVPQPRFRVEVEEGPSHGDLYELEQTTFYRVIDTRSNEAVMTFEGEMEARLDGGMWAHHRYSGVCDVSIATDADFALVKYHDGRAEKVALPTAAAPPPRR
jgi:hypothetical protein